MKKFIALSAGSAASVLALSVPTFAQDTSVVQTNDRGTTVRLYGQVNRGALLGDNGTDSEVFFVDNDNSSTRFGIIAEYEGPELTFGAQIELEAESNTSSASNGADFNEGSGDFRFNERILDLYVESARYGKLSLGQGNTASNGSAEVDLSGTSIVGYSSVADLAGSLSLNEGSRRVGDAFSNLDGLSREDRIRYDTPNFGGFQLGVSAGSNDEWDVALRYAAEFGATEFQSAIAYAQPMEEDIDSRISASASVLLGSGFNFTVATGRDDRTDEREPEFYYVKAGYRTSIFAVGETAFSIDYYDGDDIAQQEFGTPSDETSSESYGLFAVQNFEDVGLEVYGGIRNYEFDDPSLGTQPDDLTALILGARLRF
ncbi:porin [Litoreibacter roseus]|uniref:Porin n=1 Tax=Litoreibacter roseus TaxID=2601869 RepID=A0A6N6JKQ4_9RHOB|nr:porin [Litoreibacter roseus]GFE65848.1 hypothetical protein KIN_29220 [Litoreibacter roseus]